MEYTTLGSTGLKVSVAGIGCGGFSRLGLKQGKTEAEAADVVRTAIDLGVNYIDTAATYGTEGAVGLAIKGRPREELVIASKARVELGGQVMSAQQTQEMLDTSLKTIGTDYLNVYQAHGVRPGTFEHVMNEIVPVYQRAKESGKIRHIGVTESDSDHAHEMALQAVETGVFEVVLLAYHMMHQTAGHELFEKLRSHRVGSVVMYAVRSMFARPDRLREVFGELAAAGKVPIEMAGRENPLDFLLHPGGAETVTEAAYRFARHTPGFDVVLFGTGNPAHVRENVAAILKPPLPSSDLARLENEFGQLSGVGLDNHGYTK